MKWHLPSAIDIEYFIEVANARNITRAAERLGVTQPSLSLSMKRLEDLVGAPLLLRSKSGVQLTSQGERLFRRGQSMLQDWESLMRETSRSQSEISGRYTLGAHSSVALYSLNQVTKDLLHEHPSLEFRLEHDLSRKITEMVISFKIDFAVVVNPVPHPDLVLKKLADDEVTLWVSSGAYNKDVLIYDDDLMQTNEILKKLRGEKFVRSLVSHNLEVIANLTSLGAGVGILPGRVAKQSVHEGLKKLPGEWPMFKDSVYFIYRHDVQRSVAAQSLATQLFARLKSIF